MRDVYGKECDGDDFTHGKPDPGAILPMTKGADGFYWETMAGRRKKYH